MSPSPSPIDFRSIISTDDFPPETQSKLADLLDASINGNASAHSAADGLDKLCPRNEEAEGFLWALWTLLIDVSKRIPLDDARLQSLVEVLQSLSAKQSGSVEIWGSQHQLWSDMPLFGAVMREAWNGSPEFDDSPNQAQIAQWQSLNSFAARILATSVQPWTNFALWELRDGLEEPPSTDAARDTYLITTSEWIVQAGPLLYEEAQKSIQLEPSAAQSLRPGHLIEEAKPGFHEERWGFWRRRLEELSAQASAEARQKAERALQVMKSLGA